MQIQQLEVRGQKTEALRKYTRAFNAGSVIHLKRIGMSRDDAKATRRFFKQHRHMLTEEGATVFEITIILAVMAVVMIAIFGAYQTGVNHGELRSQNQRLEYLQMDVEALAKAHARAAFTDTNTVTDGGAK